MERKSSWKSRLKKAAVTGLATLIGAVAGAGCSGNLEKPDIYVETAIVSDMVTKHGYMLKGKQNQNLVYADFKNGFSAFVWNNHNFQENNTNEADIGGSYTLSVNDKLSLNVGAQHWTYPSGVFGKYDNVIKAGANYTGPINLEFDVTQLIGHDTTPSGTRYYFKASKNFPIGKTGDIDFSLTPSISTAYIDNYYAKTGLSQITPGVSLGVSKGNVSLNFFVNRQDGKMPGIEDKTWGGISLGYKF